MKASHEARFSLDRKYQKIANLLLAYVRHIQDPSKACVYALTYQEAFDLLEKRGHTKTESWIVSNGYSVPNPGSDWLRDLEPYRMTPDRWCQRVKSATGRFAVS